MEKRILTLILLLLTVSCHKPTTRTIEFWGYSERGSELIAYTMQVPIGGSDDYFDGRKRNNWGEDWERALVTTYADGSNMFITNQYTYGGLNALLRTNMPDSTYNDPRPLKFGIFGNTYWKEIRNEDIVVGYQFVPKEKLELFENCLKSLTKSKDLKERIQEKIERLEDSVKIQTSMHDLQHNAYARYCWSLTNNLKFKQISN